MKTIKQLKQTIRICPPAPRSKTRYYIDGQRVNHEAFSDAKFGADLSCFLTSEERGLRKQYCSARRPE